MTRRKGVWLHWATPALRACSRTELLFQRAFFGPRTHILGEPEVGQADVALGIQQDVLGLQVPAGASTTPISKFIYLKYEYHDLFITPLPNLSTGGSFEALVILFLGYVHTPLAGALFIPDGPRR
jgi:hypothetical protein